jgi:hypothetical protein
MADPKDNNPFLDALPPDVRAALLAQDVNALEAALRQMPYHEAEALTRWLVVAGVLEPGEGQNAPPASSDAPMVETRPFAEYPPGVAAALVSGNVDAIYAALAELMPDHADRVYAQLKQQGLL